MSGYLEIFGLILAFLDFWNLSRYLERFLDRCRERLKPYIHNPLSPEGRRVFGGFLKFTLMIVILFFGGSLFGSYTLSGAIVVALEAAAFIIVLPLIILFGATVLYLVMRVLNLPPSGTVGSIGLVVTLLGCLLD
jgi:hypothetical protein